MRRTYRPYLWSGRGEKDWVFWKHDPNNIGRKQFGIWKTLKDSSSLSLSGMLVASQRTEHGVRSCLLSESSVQSFGPL